MKHLLFTLMAFTSTVLVTAQSVGIGTTTPQAMLHIKGNADTSQLVVDAHSLQSNSMPLFKLRDAGGDELMRIHSDAPYNLFLGYAAGRVNNANTSSQKGLFNTFVGSNSGYYNTDGSFNTALGRSALYQNTTGWNNTGLGFKALFSNTTGIFNTAVGNEALLSNISGSNNTALGTNALKFNISASGNTAIGSSALQNQFYNSGNISVLTNNTAVGVDALRSNQPTTSSNGYYNTAVGGAALLLNTTGYLNTAIGVGALQYNTTGTLNIALGYLSGTQSNAPAINNTVGIANHDALNEASNQVIIGNNSMVFTGGHVNWGIYSDARIKKNVQEDVKGLDFINRLRPVTYYRSVKTFTQLTSNREGPDFAGKYDVEKIRFSGFLAQEVEIAAKNAGYDFDGVYVPQNEHELYKLSYGSFVVPLVKAVQEQQQIIGDKQKQIDVLKARLEKLETMEARVKKLERLLTAKQ